MLQEKIPKRVKLAIASSALVLNALLTGACDTDTKSTSPSWEATYCRNEACPDGGQEIVEYGGGGSCPESVTIFKNLFDIRFYLKQGSCKITKLDK